MIELLKSERAGLKWLLLSVLLCCGLVSNAGEHSPEKPVLRLYVSKQGNDAWSGKLPQPDRKKTDGPFATLERAKQEIRNLKSKNALPKGEIIVEIGEGTYELSHTFELEARDSGDSLSRIIYQGEKGKEVRLSGGKAIKQWSVVTDEAILRRLYPHVRGKVYQADLLALGISDFGTPEGKGLELFFDDKPMWISRYPNEGFMKITGVVNEDPVDIRGTKGDKAGKFYYEDPRIDSWKEENDPWVSGYWFWDWSEQRHKVAKIDSETKLLQVAPPLHYYGYRTGQWFFGFNLLSEIDQPGEYYVDRQKGILYFYPPSDVTRSLAYVSVIPNIVRMKDVKYVTIRGVIMEGARETVAQIYDCVGTLIAGCTIRNAGVEGITIKGGMYNGVSGCDVYEVGAGGISIGAGDRTTLTPAHSFADNNRIHHIARIKRMYSAGIALGGVGNRATHNQISKLPHIAIAFGGNDHLMEYNEIFEVSYESNDAGAIYAGRNWTMRGNKIRYNYLHDISGFEGKGCVGVYLDDAFCGVEVVGNVFENVTRAMMIGGGRDNKVLNNIFINCVPALHVDARCMGWMHDHPEEWLQEEKEKGTISGIAFNKPPYSERYPELLTLLADEPKAPKGNVIANNINLGGVWDKNAGYWKTSIEDKARPYVTIKDNVVSSAEEVRDPGSQGVLLANPLFVNPDNPKVGKFQLQKNSPALNLGFKQIPFDQIGLYKSEERATWLLSSN